MTITTIHCKQRSKAFTLVEVIIGATLGTMILVGVLSAFLMLGRSGANIGNYCTMETESRRALEELSQDLRMAKNVTWNSDQSVTLEVPDNYTATGNRVTYALDSTTHDFYRMPGVATETNPKQTLVRSVSSCTFARFDRVNAATTSPASTKRIHFTLVVRKKSQTVAAASNTILSASYILRNKPVN
jgi:Tfp pilus assembly protein PilW